MINVVLFVVFDVAAFVLASCEQIVYMKYQIDEPLKATSVSL